MIGENVEDKVLSINTAKHDGRMYYQYELEPPHVLITATAAGNRLYLFSVTGSGMYFYHTLHGKYCLIIVRDQILMIFLLLVGLQWKRHYKDLKRIAESFRVV